MRTALAVLLVTFAAAAGAHPAPNSVLRLQFEAQAVHAEYWVPVSELAFARAPASAREDFAAYLMQHFAIETPDGAPWRVMIDGVRETDYLEHPFVVADIRLVPPAGIAPGQFVLVDDTVTHEVRNHIVYVVTHGAGGVDLLGMLQYPARRLPIERPG